MSRYSHQIKRFHLRQRVQIFLLIWKVQNRQENHILEIPVFVANSDNFVEFTLKL